MLCCQHPEEYNIPHPQIGVLGFLLNTREMTVSLPGGYYLEESHLLSVSRDSADKKNWLRSQESLMATKLVVHTALRQTRSLVTSATAAVSWDVSKVISTCQSDGLLLLGNLLP